MRGLNDEQLEERLVWLYSEARVRVNILRGAVPFPSMKNATMEELRHYRENPRDPVLIMIVDLEIAMDAYADEEPNKNEVDWTYWFGGIVILEAYEWIDDL